MIHSHVNRAEHSQTLLQHINSQDPHIQFTVEPTQQGSLPFLDTLVTIEPDNTFSTTAYRKSTHTDQYLHWDSNHPHHSQTKCLQHISSQGQGSVIFTGQTGPGTTTYQDNSTTMPVPQLGPQPIASQVHLPQQQQHYKPIGQQPKQKEYYHSSPLHAQDRWKVQETLQKQRNTSTLQRNQHPQNIIRQPQG